MNLTFIVTHGVQKTEGKQGLVIILRALQGVKHSLQVRSAK